MTGGPDSADFDLFPSLGEGDLERLTLLEPKLELYIKLMLEMPHLKNPF